MRAISQFALLGACVAALTACQGGGGNTETKIVETKVPVVVKEDVVIGTPDDNPASKDFSVIAQKIYSENSLKVILTPNRDDLRITSVEKQDNYDGERKRVPIPVVDSSEVTDLIPAAANDLRPWDQVYAVTIVHESFPAPKVVTIGIKQKKDLVVAGEIKISTQEFASSDLDLGTLTIKENSSLTLDRNTIKINVENLIAEKNSALQTLSKQDAETPAKDYEPGRDGGTIRLNAVQASGELQIFLRGGKGGKGQTGETSTVTGGKGDPGADGKWYFEPPRRFPKEVLSEPVKPIALTWRNICLENPGNGGPGRDGGEGGRGKQGERGGNSGRMDLSIESGSLKYTVAIIPGTGGDGGNGGQGGPKGEGGDPGKAGPCPAASKGPDGGIGPTGKPGPEGLKGNYGEFCPSRPSVSFSCNFQPQFEGTL